MELTANQKRRIRKLVELWHQQNLLRRDESERIRSYNERRMRLEQQLRNARLATNRNEALEAQLEGEIERLKRIALEQHEASDRAAEAAAPIRRLLDRIFEHVEGQALPIDDMLERVL
ncbi:MAG TPA: hypothetical protein VF329_13540 [Gammaproteobacteria bacterium]